MRTNASGGTGRAIVVGSGPAGVFAARGLLDRGWQVLMLDAGMESPPSLQPPDGRSFAELRRTDPDQSRYLLGPRFEALDLDESEGAVQLTPPRRHVVADVQRYFPVVSESFRAVRSLARGGLAAAWGGLAVPYDARDLAGTPLDSAALAPWIARVTRAIGVCGRSDDLAPWLGEATELQPAPEPNEVAARILSRYQQQRHILGQRGVVLGHPRLALGAFPEGVRRGDDLEFYTPRGVFRPTELLGSLLSDGLTYSGGQIVERFEERRDGVRVRARLVRGDMGFEHHADVLVLAAGPLASGAIALRSLAAPGEILPVATKPVTWYACISPSHLGRAAAPRRHSLAQLIALHAPSAAEPPRLFCQIHGYRSLMLFRLLRMSGLGVRDGVRLLREARDALVMLNVFQPSPPSGGTMWLEPGPAGDVTRIEWKDPPGAAEARHRAEWALIRHLPALGVLPLHRHPTRMGTSIHYGGTLPAVAEGGPLTTTPEGRLRPTQRVFVADGSILARLSAKPPTLTVMAHALRLGSTLTNPP